MSKNPENDVPKKTLPASNLTDLNSNQREIRHLKIIMQVTKC